MSVPSLLYFASVMTKAGGLFFSLLLPSLLTLIGLKERAFESPYIAELLNELKDKWGGIKSYIVTIIPTNIIIYTFKLAFSPFEGSIFTEVLKVLMMMTPQHLGLFLDPLHDK